MSPKNSAPSGGKLLATPPHFGNCATGYVEYYHYQCAMLDGKWRSVFELQTKTIFKTQISKIYAFPLV